MVWARNRNALLLLSRLLSKQLDRKNRGNVLLEKTVPFHQVRLNRIRIGRKLGAKVMPRDEEKGNQREDGKRQYRTQHQHRDDGEAGCQAHAQNGGKKIGAEIGNFLDRFLERIHDCPRRSALVVVGRKPVQVAQYIHAKPERHFLGGSECQVISETG